MSNAKIVTAVVITAVIVGGGAYLWQKNLTGKTNQNVLRLEQQSDALEQKLIEYDIPSSELEGKIEDWSLYEEYDDAVSHLNLDKCGNKEFEDFIDKAKGGPINKLKIDNLELGFTPNYNNWPNYKFRAFLTDDTAFCGVGSMWPLHAYEDKLLWVRGCPAIVLTTEDMEYAEQCEKTSRAVDNYFRAKYKDHY